MPKITLVSSAVAYNLYTLLNAQDSQIPRNVASLALDMPQGSIEAANAGATTKVGHPDSPTTPTDVTSPELTLQESGYSYPGLDHNGYSLDERYVKGSANNVVLDVVAISL